MESAFDFLKHHFSHGLCYPVWIEDQEFVSRAVGKSPSSTGMNLDSSLLSIDSENAYRRTSRRHVRGSNNSNRASNSSSHSEECRDAPCSENALLSALREGEERNDIGDLDEVIAKIVRKRDELLKEKIQSDEEIKRLRLENENLKNLNSIGKRITNTQRDELTKLKLNAASDRKKIVDLEKSFLELQIRTNDAKHALDGSNFLSGISSCDGSPRPIEGAVGGKALGNTGVLDSFFGWTIGDKELEEP